VEHQPRPASVFDHIRKNLGTLFLIAWVFSLLFVYKLYVNHRFPVGAVTLLIAILAFSFYYHCYQVKQSLKTISGANALRDRYRSYTVLAFWVTVLALLIAAPVAFAHGWSLVTLIVVLSASLCNTIAFILFLSFRVSLEDWKPKASNKFAQALVSPVQVVGPNRSYVRLFAVLGFTALGCMIFSHIRPDLLNPLVIVFLYLYLYYGAIVILIKHYKYYTLDPRQYLIPESPGGASGFFKFYAPILGVVL
jgi:phosphate/sulfate permease